MHYQHHMDWPPPMPVMKRKRLKSPVGVGAALGATIGASALGVNPVDKTVNPAAALVGAIGGGITGGLGGKVMDLATRPGRNEPQYTLHYPRNRQMTPGQRLRGIASAFGEHGVERDVWTKHTTRRMGRYMESADQREQGKEHDTAPKKGKKERNPAFKSTRKGIKIGAVLGAGLGGAAGYFATEDPRVTALSALYGMGQGASAGGSLGMSHDIWRHESNDILSTIVENDNAEAILDYLLSEGTFIDDTLSTGKLHQVLGVPEGKPIPLEALDKLEKKADKDGNTRLSQMVKYAKSIKRKK